MVRIIRVFVAPGMTMAEPTPADRGRVPPVTPIPFPDRERAVPRLPSPLTSFVGREREVGAVVDLLRRPDVRLVTVTGAGGVGKTRLAVEAAQEVARDFPDGLLFVALAPVLEARLVASTLADALGVHEATDAPLVERLIATPRDRRLLLILDNFEHLVEEASLVGELFVACPHLKALVTSRAALRLLAEHVFPLSPLALPDRSRLSSVDDLGDFEAVKLFAYRAAAADARFVLDATNARAVAEICCRLDGLPLAIELAARWIDALPPRTILARLDHRLALLTSGPRDAPARLRTMADAIAWSYDYLTPGQQSLFRCLSVFVGGFTLDAAGAVHADGLDVLAGVAALVGKSLVQRGVEIGLSDQSENEPRYLMLETIREFGLEQLKATGEAETVRRRHAEHFLAYVERVAPRDDAPGPPCLELVDAEEDNLRAALAWADERGEVETLLGLAAALPWYWRLRGRFAEGQAWLDRAAARSAATPPGQKRHEVLWYAGAFARSRGDLARARTRADEIGGRANAAGNETWLAEAMMLHFHVDVDVGDFRRAHARAADALEIFDRRDNQVRASFALWMQGWAAWRLGNLDGAEALLNDAAARYRRLDDVVGEANVFSDLAEVARLRGDYRRAAALVRPRLKQTWDAWGLRWCLQQLGQIAAAAGEAERAARLLGSAEAHRERIGAVLSSESRPDHEASVALAKAALGEEAFAIGWAAGRAMPLDEACAEAATVANNAPVNPISEAATAQIDTALRYGLTPRERDVLQLLVEGRPDREIAALLFVSPKTVGSHITSILGKLAVPSRAAAVAHAHRSRLP